MIHESRHCANNFQPHDRLAKKIRRAVLYEHRWFVFYLYMRSQSPGSRPCRGRLGVVIVAAGLAFQSVPAMAQSEEAPARPVAGTRRPVTLEQVLALRDISDIQVSPAGGQIAVLISSSDLSTNGVATRLEIVSAADGVQADVPELPDAPSHIRWSPDGTRIAFFASKNGRAAVWTLTVATRSLVRVCDYDRTNAFLPQTGEWLRWSADGRHLAFAGTAEPKPHGADPLVVTRLRYKTRTSFSDNRRTHIFVVASAGGTPRQLTRGDFDEHSIDWTPDGGEIVFVSNRRPDPDAVHNYDIFAVNVESAAIRQLTNTPGVEMNPRVSPDGRWIAFTATTRPVTTIDSVAEDAHLWVMPSGGGPARHVNGALDRRTGAFTWAPDSTRLVFSAGDRGRTLIYQVSRQGGVPAPIVDRPVQIGPFSQANDGTLAFGLADAVTPREVFLLGPGNREPRQLSRLNTELVSAWALATPERVAFTSRDGLEIEGWLYLPPSRNGRVPLLLNIHGGPHGMFGYSFDPLTQAYAARGYAVLALNPRGSSGYGQRFADGTLGNWGGGDYEDLMAGVDHVLATRPEIDPHRLGVTGRSYGGFMNNWIITHTERFKASVSWASVSNLVSFYATSMYQDLIHAEFNGHPWDGDTYARLWKWSPLAYAKHAKTPTLFIHGEQDNDVHITEAEHLFTALRMQGIDAALARYPREGHGFREPKHRLDSMRRAIDWFDRYLRPGMPSMPRPR